MSLFQNSVLNKYLKGLDSQQVEYAWTKYTAHFHNREIQENIRNSKEEQYQGEFLIDLFVNVFGYVKNPIPNFNLTTELKNLKGAKKTDGAILQNDKAIAVIELKGTNTVDLAKVETQAFGYKNNQPDCVYVITSNFEKLRFYTDNAVDFEEFNLFQLSKERFEILYLCLSAENLLKDIPKQIKDESLSQEANVTKKLYKDYSQFRNEIFDNIQKNNPDYDKLTLFKKTQKLLDRFLFIFFAEDRLLLPPNSIREIVNQWTTLRDDLDAYVPLYDRFKKYFEYMNTGYRGKKYDIFAYNGGLFAPDDILDNIQIDDELLYKHTLNLSNYDFESEVSVNILGHIFEHSLTEIENIQAQLEGTEIDKSKTKRKKDGVFYTPKYITKYIVDNTVGKLCEEKKIELGIQETDYEKERKGRKKATIQKLIDQLDGYRDWLLQLTICDPACGSGAFLNQALEFLIEEHRYIDELKAKLLGDAMIFSEVQNAILENNLFGVDINEESVEIAKLSLWLRTAQKGRKLTTLNDNIKCGNSLIDDIEVAGDKAFNWQQEFPEIFTNGGFDVVIGNPPYVQSHSISEPEKNYIYKYFETAEYQINTYGIFVEQFIKLLKPNSYYSVIIPNYWLATKFDKSLRRKIFIDNHALEVINTYEVFESATVDTLMLTGQKTKGEKKNTSFLSISKKLKSVAERLEAINLKIWDYSEQKQFSNGDEEALLSFNKGLKLTGESTLKDYLIFKKGMQPYEKGKGKPPQTREMMKEKVYHSTTKIDDTYLPLLGARHIKRNYLAPFDTYIKYGKNLAAPRDPKIFEGERILINRILSRDRIDGVILSDTFINNTDVFNLIPNTESSISVKTLYALIVSKLCARYFKSANVNLNRNAFPKINVNTLEAFPVPKIESNIQKEIEGLVDQIVLFTSQLHQRSKKFITRLQDNLGVEKVSKKMAAFYDYDFKTFIAELKKKKISLSLVQQDEWEEYFTAYKTEINQLQTEIANTDAQIDTKVYELYGLTEDEIKVVVES